MGYLKEININNYRNFSKKNLFFSSGCNIILGKNGSGKTNILEAISLFEKGRGFRKDKINNLINFENLDLGFNINSIFSNDDNDIKVSVFTSEKNLKRLSINNNIDKESVIYFESLFSIIFFLPEMERLFVSTPSSRRNFLDRLIFGFNKQYSLIINNYKKLIHERQNLLKNSTYDESWIYGLEKNIVELGSKIYDYRNKHVKNLNEILKSLSNLDFFSHTFILKINDDALNNYATMHQDSELYLLKLKENRKLDYYSGGCSVGPHRSDLLGFREKDNFNINQFSTGQQKTVILLIIISQCKFLIEKLKLNPIILLDEICSHLDQVNRDLLLYLIDQLKVQVFMTGTEKSFFSFLSTKADYCNIV